jgi:hypothetical protein
VRCEFGCALRPLGSDDFPRAAKQQAAADLTTAARDGALSIPMGEPLPLDDLSQRTTASTQAATAGFCLPSRSGGRLI